MLFLIEYDRPSGSLIQIQTYAAEDSVTANQTRLALELDRLHMTSTREVVILDAESAAALRKTHSRYFESLASLANPARRSR
jgi:hypothetical protein